MKKKKKSEHSKDWDSSESRKQTHSTWVPRRDESRCWRKSCSISFLPFDSPRVTKELDILSQNGGGRGLKRDVVLHTNYGAVASHKALAPTLCVCASVDGQKARTKFEKTFFPINVELSRLFAFCFFFSSGSSVRSAHCPPDGGVSQHHEPVLAAAGEAQRNHPGL